MLKGIAGFFLPHPISLGDMACRQKGSLAALLDNLSFRLWRLCSNGIRYKMSILAIYDFASSHKHSALVQTECTDYF
jgi:hypothetical protein